MLGAKPRGADRNSRVAIDAAHNRGHADQAAGRVARQTECRVDCRIPGNKASRSECAPEGGRLGAAVGEGLSGSDRKDAIAIAAGGSGPAARSQCRGGVVPGDGLVPIQVAVVGGLYRLHVVDDTLDPRVLDKFLALENASEQQANDDQHNRDLHQRETGLTGMTAAIHVVTGHILTTHYELLG